MSNNFQYSIQKSKLQGKVKISGAKNSILKLLTASLLTDDKVILNNVPTSMIDVETKINMLKYLGKSIEAKENNILISNDGGLNTELIWEDLSVRTTLLILGALVTRFGYAKVPVPGGCSIGNRGYDIHIDVLKALGAEISFDGDYIVAKSKRRLKGNEIYLRIRSTGATENALITSVLAEGTSVIWGPHIRPEIMDLIDMLRNMGAKIDVRGNESIRVEGVKVLHGVEHTTIPDNMEAITFLIAAAISNSSIEIENFPYNDLEIPLIFLRESGLKYSLKHHILKTYPGDIYPIEISTGPYPGINSDMQPLMSVWALKAKGNSRIIDLRFPDRFQYVEELRKMGADINIESNIININGGITLKGNRVIARDLRCGAAMILAGLIAEGETIIENAWQIERGYDDIIEKFQSIGTKIEKLIQ